MLQVITELEIRLLHSGLNYVFCVFGGPFSDPAPGTEEVDGVFLALVGGLVVSSTKA